MFDHPNVCAPFDAGDNCLDMRGVFLPATYALMVLAIGYAALMQIVLRLCAPTEPAARPLAVVRS